MFGDVEVHNPPPIMRENDNHEEDAELDRGYDEEIHRHQVPNVLIKERLPRRERRRDAWTLATSLVHRQLVTKRGEPDFSLRRGKASLLPIASMLGYW